MGTLAALPLAAAVTGVIVKPVGCRHSARGTTECCSAPQLLRTETVTPLQLAGWRIRAEKLPSAAIGTIWPSTVSTEPRSLI